MAKKPKLELVGQTASNPLAPPRTLGKAGRTAWQAIMSDYNISDAGGLMIVEQIAGAHDRLADCHEAIAREGQVLHTKTGPREHPLLRTELGCRSFILRALHRLGIDSEPVKPVGRPPAKFGWTPDADE